MPEKMVLWNHNIANNIQVPEKETTLELTSKFYTWTYIPVEILYQREADIIVTKGCWWR